MMTILMTNLNYIKIVIVQIIEFNCNFIYIKYYPDITIKYFKLIMVILLN